MFLFFIYLNQLVLFQYVIKKHQKDIQERANQRLAAKNIPLENFDLCYNINIC